MSLGKYPNLQACILDQQKKGHTKESAEKICSAIQAKLAGTELPKDLSDTELKAANQSLSDSINEFFEYLSEVEESNEGCVRSIIEVLAVGELRSRDLVVTAEMLDEMVSNFKANSYGVDLQVNEGHYREGQALGWFKELYREGNKLMAVIEWNELGQNFLTKKIYRYFSAEIAFRWYDDRTNLTFSNVLIGGALTNIPAFKTINVNGIGLSENLQILLTNHTNMEFFKLFLSELKTKDIVSKSEKATLQKMLASLDEEQKTEVDAEVKEVEAKPEEEVKDEVEKKEDETVEDKDEDKKEDVEEKKDEVLTETQLSEMKLAEAERNELVLLREEKKQGVLRERVNGIALSEGKPSFRKDQKGLSEFVAGLSDEQYKDFTALLSTVVIPTADMIKELGSGAQGEHLDEISEEDKKIAAVAKLAETFEAQGMPKHLAVEKAQKEIFNKQS